MKIPQKIRWITSIEGNTISDIFSKGKRKQIRELKIDIQDNGYIFGIKKITQDELGEFQEIYTGEMSKKENAVIHDIYNRYIEELDNGYISLIYVRDSKGKLVTAGIVVQRSDMFILAFKVVVENEDTSQLSLGLGHLIDYLVFEYAFENVDIKRISFGKDRNAYGLIGAQPTLAMVKIARKMLPYDFEGNSEIEIDLENITTDTLIFYSKDSIDGYFSDALLFVSQNMTEEDLRVRYGALLANNLIRTEVSKF